MNKTILIMLLVLCFGTIGFYLGTIFMAGYRSEEIVDKFWYFLELISKNTTRIYIENNYSYVSIIPESRNLGYKTDLYAAGLIEPNLMIDVTDMNRSWCDYGNSMIDVTDRRLITKNNRTYFVMSWRGKDSE